MTWYSNAPGSFWIGSPLLGIESPPPSAPGDDVGAGAADTWLWSLNRERKRSASRWRMSATDGFSSCWIRAAPRGEHGLSRCTTGNVSLLLVPTMLIRSRLQVNMTHPYRLQAHIYGPLHNN
jgi:hypothetical protein